MKKLFSCFVLCVSLIACVKKEEVVDDRYHGVPKVANNYIQPEEILFIKERNICFAARIRNSATLVVVDCEKAGMLN